MKAPTEGGPYAPYVQSKRRAVYLGVHGGNSCACGRLFPAVVRGRIWQTAVVRAA